MAPEDPRVKAQKELDGERLADFLDDAAHLIGGNGAPLIQGRRLIYRFAAAAPFWMGELCGYTRLPPGVSRRAASGMLGVFRPPWIDHRRRATLHRLARRVPLH